MTEQLGIDLPDADYDQSVDSDLCDDPDKCPIAACGCRRVMRGRITTRARHESWQDSNNWRN